MRVSVPESLNIPVFERPFSLSLPSEITELRNLALSAHRHDLFECFELLLIDAESWKSHGDNEDWLVWRARRVAERLRKLPIHLETGERIVGKPLFHRPSEEEVQQLETARSILRDMPPFPGGDAEHFNPDYEKLFRLGIGGLLQEISEKQSDSSKASEQKTFYNACRMVLEGMSAYVLRTADSCDDMASRDPKDAERWKDLAKICRRVATAPPATFHEALQLMFLCQIALWFGEDHILVSPGRMDQTLIRFYEEDIASGRITRRTAFELICCLYIQMNRILKPGSAVAVMIGGRDGQGLSVTNDLSYLCLAARLATQLVYPTVAVAWHENLPDELMDFSMRVLATGVGDPAFFNDRIISEGLQEHGVSEPDSHNYINSSCVEIKVAGTSNIWVASPYINCPGSLLDVMTQVADKTLPAPQAFEAFAERVRQNLSAKISDAAQRYHRIWQERRERGGFPLASCFISDCLERGLDYDRGGARYNWVENSFVGLANLVDGLVAIKRLVYDAHELSLEEFYRILESDFEEAEAFRQKILNTIPKYGNDDDEVDTLAKEWAEFLINSVESNTVGDHRYVPGFFCWVMHEELGAGTGATPDGRHAGAALADGAGAAQGREKHGPTATVLSTTKWSHKKALGGLVHNAKFTKDLLQDDQDRRAVRNVIETYLKRGGFEIQINVVDKEELLEAREHPERYPDLLVRVAGYSDYFIHLNKNTQDEIIRRTEFSGA